MDFDIPGGRDPRDPLDVRDCRDCGKPTVFPSKARTSVCAACAGQPIERPVTDRTCPADGTILTPEWRSDVVVDRCPSCRGMWLDEGELERIVAATRTAASERGAADLLLNILAGRPPFRP